MEKNEEKHFFRRKIWLNVNEYSSFSTKHKIQNFIKFKNISDTMITVDSSNSVMSRLYHR